jgi:hypothetical protein
MPDDLGILLARRRWLQEIDALTRSLATFFRAAWPVLEPATPLSWSWHYELLCEWLELIATGRFKQLYPDKQILIINVPPRTAKSTLVTIAFPVWTWLTRPSTRFLCASYAEKLSADHSIKRRNLSTSQWFQERFGSRFALAEDRNRIDFYENTSRGYHAAISVGGVGTGLGGEILRINSQWRCNHCGHQWGEIARPHELSLDEIRARRAANQRRGWPWRACSSGYRR